MKKTYLLIDGYNVIHAWRTLDKWGDDMAAARDELLTVTADYSAYRECESILVFDAPSAPISSVEENSGVTVVFTSEEETADKARPYTSSPATVWNNPSSWARAHTASARANGARRSKRRKKNDAGSTKRVLWATEANFPHDFPTRSSPNSKNSDGQK